MGGDNMNYQKIVCPNYNIHLIQDNRFHSIILKVFFTENVSLERITYRNCLINLLTYATKNYDTKQKIICKAQDLYSTYPDATVSRFGNLLVTKFMISTISSQYLNQDNIKDNLLLLKEFFPFLL